MKTEDTIRGNAEAERNISILLMLREKRGLSQHELSQKSGVSIGSIHRYETGKALPTVKNYNKLCKVFDWKEVLKRKERKLKKDKISVISPLLPPEAVPIPQSPKYEFTEGHKYRISSPGESTSRRGKKAVLDNYIFLYEGKRGIHHVFREVCGKWIATYTDSQLVGKSVKEVEE